MKKYVKPTLKSLALGSEDIMDITVSVAPGTYTGDAGAKENESDEEEIVSPRKTVWDD